jgi:hypothetical protein
VVVDIIKGIANVEEIIIILEGSIVVVEVPVDIENILEDPQKTPEEEVLRIGDLRAIQISEFIEKGSVHVITLNKNIKN